jgi:transcription termination/antitermination protein NusG
LRVFDGGRDAMKIPVEERLEMSAGRIVRTVTRFREVNEEGVEKHRRGFARGETVRIIDGSFSNFYGVVEQVDLERDTLTLVVMMFGRPTPVELGLLQVERL